MSDYRLVYVRWRDSFGVGASWSETAGLTSTAHHCLSVGWLVSESEDAICVVPHMSPANEETEAVEQGCGDMTIPRSAIVEITDLKRSEQ